MKKYDLRERTLKYSLCIGNFCKQFDYNSIDYVVIKQLCRSAFSIGANYAEADDSMTKKDFLYKISLCRKESKETIYWLKVLNGLTKRNSEPLIEEAIELNKIFFTILKNSNS